jgi:hypothetical protein
VELHTVNKQKPTEKLVGRKRETAEEESEEHYPITARGLRDPFSTREFDGILGGDEAVRSGLLHLLLGDGGAHPVGGGSLGHGALRGQMFHAHLVQGEPGGCAQAEETRKVSNGGGGGNELVNSKIPHCAFIYLLGEGSWVETWRKDRKLQPTNGQKIMQPTKRSKIRKITVLPIERFTLLKSNVSIDVISNIYI